MSILILGKSICRICSKKINEGDIFFSFPAFVINLKDPLYFFSDATFHMACLCNHKLGPEAKKYAELYIESIKPSNRNSLFTGRNIEDYRSHLFIDYISADENSFLHKFNFVHIDKREIEMWDERVQFITELIKLKESEGWQEQIDSDYLGRLINQLSI